MGLPLRRSCRVGCVGRIPHFSPLWTTSLHSSAPNRPVKDDFTAPVLDPGPSRDSESTHGRTATGGVRSTPGVGWRSRLPARARLQEVGTCPHAPRRRLGVADHDRRSGRAAPLARRRWQAELLAGDQGRRFGPKVPFADHVQRHTEVARDADQVVALTDGVDPAVGLIPTRLEQCVAIRAGNRRRGRCR